MAGRMSANARILTALVGTNHCIPTTPFSKFHCGAATEFLNSDSRFLQTPPRNHAGSRSATGALWDGNECKSSIASAPPYGASPYEQKLRFWLTRLTAP